MRFVAVEAHSVRKVGDFAVHPCVKITLAQKLLEKFLVMAFTPLDERCHQVDFLTVHLIDNDIDNLVVGVFDHLFAGVVGIGLAGAREKKAHKVVNLCGCANC